MTQEELKKLVSYDPVTGVMTLLSCYHKSKEGKKLGCKDKQSGYCRISLNGISHYAHRLAWLYVYGENPKQIIDHINGDKLDNKISNLRLANKSENAVNSKLKINNSTRVKNVSFIKAREMYTVTLHTNGKYKFIGSFKDLELAELVAFEAREKYHGAFANHGGSQWPLS